MRGVGTRHDDVVVIFVAMNADRDRVLGIFDNSLNDVDALFIQKILHGLDVVHTLMTFRKRRCCGCISFFALVDADASRGAP